jgi:hypothetical protein
MGNGLTIALMVVAILVVLRTLRSTPAQGQKVLRRWGIANPTEEQGQIVAVYLRERRKLYPWAAIAVVGFVVVCQAVFSLGDDTPWAGVLLFSVIASLLVAELIATTRRPSEPKRSATIASRMVDTSTGSRWFVLLTLAACVVASLGVVRVCQLRGPITSDLAVDAALRVRSGRVALGTAIFLGLGLVASANLIWWSPATDAHAAAGLAGPAAVDLPPIPSWILPVDTWIEGVNLVGIVCLAVWIPLSSPLRTQRLVAAHV